jgi:chromate transporter
MGLAMKKDARFYLKLFLSTFKLSAFTFGGGYVIVPLMRKKFVHELQWIDDTEMLDLIAIGQSAPGPIAVNTSIMIGYRLAGIPGALVTVLGTVMPPLFTISIITLFYAQFKDSLIVSRILRGMQAGVVAVILDVVITMGKTVLKKRELIPVAIMVAAFIAAAILKINVMLIVLACGILGAAITLLKQHRQGLKEEAK